MGGVHRSGTGWFPAEELSFGRPTKAACPFSDSLLAWRHFGHGSQTSPMKTTDMRMLVSSRYSGDIELLKSIRMDPKLVEEQKRVEILRQRSRMRMRLLATAVRVSDGMLSNVAHSMTHISSRVDVGKPLEAFVFSEGEVNAFVSEGSSRFLVGLSSGAVETLTADELEFVIGHELGHALFGHTEVAAGYLAENANLSEDRSKLLRAWQRSAEISADRVGLLCCEDLDVAATALVKTLAGLSFDGRKISPSAISGQLDSLIEEVMNEGASDLWEHSHPFPPLRIRALEAFWKDYQAQKPENGDAEIRRYLSLMDAPTSQGALHSGSHEGLLARFLFWGGLFVGTADGPLLAAVKPRLEALTLPGVDLDDLLGQPIDLAAHSLEKFKEAKQTRRSKLKANELTSLMKQLVAFAALDNHFSDHEKARLSVLAGELGLHERAVELLIQQYQEGN